MQEKPDVVIRRYSNRRLYDTSCRSYIPLPRVLDHVRARRSVCVIDVETGADLTRATLLQLLFLSIEGDPHARLTAGMLHVLLQPGDDGASAACAVLEAATREEHPVRTKARSDMRARDDARDTEARLRTLEARLRMLESSAGRSHDE